MMREMFWRTCGWAFDHLMAAALLIGQGPTTARNHLREHIYGWPAEEE